VQQQQKARLGRKELPGGLDPVKPTAPLTGVLELGGGSLQVTFAVAEGRRIPPNQAAPLEMPGLAGRQLYSHSFDGFGLQVGRGWGCGWQGDVSVLGCAYPHLSCAGAGGRLRRRLAAGPVIVVLT
jgi:hypothetical protein